jgi:septum site-determining protein MinC
MNSDFILPDIVSPIALPANEVNSNSQVRFKSEEGRLMLILPAEAAPPSTSSWSDIWQQLKQRLNGGDRLWQPNTTVDLIASDRLLDGRQLQAIADALAEVQLLLKRVSTSRRQTAVAAATAGYSVEQTYVAPNQTLTSSSVPLAEPLYLQMTVRSGIEIRHSGTVVVLGDLNPGGIVVANWGLGGGDKVLCWGWGGGGGDIMGEVDVGGGGVVGGGRGGGWGGVWGGGVGVGVDGGGGVGGGVGGGGGEAVWKWK